MQRKTAEDLVQQAIILSSVNFLIPQASSLAASANAAALEEMDQKLKPSDKELDPVNKRLDEAQGKLFDKMCNCLMPDMDDLDHMLILYGDDLAVAATKVEGLREALKKAEAEETLMKMAADKAMAQLEKAKLAAEQHEDQVTEV